MSVSFLVVLLADNGKDFTDWSVEYPEEQFDYVKRMCDATQRHERNGRKFAVVKRVTHATNEVLH